MKLKKSLVPIAVSLGLAAAVCAAFALQNSSEHKVLFEKAKFTMKTKGDLKGAIQLFEEIIRKYPNERDYAAKSQLYIGFCYEKLGFGQAQAAFQKVVENYPEQTEAVAVAREKLVTLTRLQTLSIISDERFHMSRLWEGSSWWRGCSISPLGGFFAFADRMNGYGEVATYDLSSGKVRRLTNDATKTEGAYDCAVSPDGQHIAYCWLKNNDGSQELRVVGTDGSRPKTLFRDKDGLPVIPFHWSPDGKQILVFHKGIAMISVDDGSIRILKESKPESWQGRMRISPDGRYIAYDWPPQGDNAGRDIFILAADGSFNTPVIRDSSDDYLLDWCPDGKSLLVASDRTGSWSAWQIRVKEGKPNGPAELVKGDIGRIRPLGVTQDGSFYFLTTVGGSDIYTAMIDVNAGKILETPKNPLERFLGGNRSPSWSPDGKYLAYISAQSPPFADLVIRIRSEETGEERDVSPLLGWFDSIQWFPDGTSVMVYGTDAEGRRGLYRVDIETGAVEPLLMSAGWLGPDGKTIYSCTYRDSDNLTSIIAFDLQSGKKKEIWRGQEDVVSVNPSPDGQWLALSIGRGYDAPSPCLAVIPTNGGEIRELVRTGPSAVAWTPDSKQILYAKTITENGWGSSREELWIVPVSGGSSTNLNLTSKGLWHLTIHPDGDRIAYTSDKSRAEIWVMENFLPGTKAQKGSK
jgi:Tol biopolymer transport system component